MNRSVLTTRVAVIVIIGHVIVFINALALGILSMMRGIDAIQTLLMASPILAATAISAFNALDDGADTSSADMMSKSYSFFAVFFPCLLVVVVCALFGLFWAQIDGFGPDQLKIALGGVETFFGVFLGAISRKLFGKTNNFASIQK